MNEIDPRWRHKGAAHAAHDLLRGHERKPLEAKRVDIGACFSILLWDLVDVARVGARHEVNNRLRERFKAQGGRNHSAVWDLCAAYADVREGVLDA